jgi:hypothetical protein
MAPRFAFNRSSVWFKALPDLSPSVCQLPDIDNSFIIKA